MRRAIPIAALAAAAVLAGAPTANATLVCPVGISPPSVYCANVNPPAAETGAANEVSSTSATLKGTVNTYGAASTWWFEYGTSTSYGSKSGEGSIAAQPSQPASATSSSVGMAVSGLKPSTTYHYRLVAKNAGGTTFGADRTFTTPNAAGLVLLKTVLKALGDRAVLIPLHCARRPRCVGTLLLLPAGRSASAAHGASAGHRTSARHTASAGHAAPAAGAASVKRKAVAVVYGSAKYSIAYSHDAKVRVLLSAAARGLLAKRGRLTVAVVAVADGKRTRLGTLTIKAARARTAPTHVTHAKGKPGFTG